MNMGTWLLPAPPQRAGVDLIDAEEEIERRQQPQQQRAVGHHLGLAVEEGGEIGRQQQDGHQQHGGDGHGQVQRLPHASLGPLHITHAQILAHKGGGRQRQGLHRQDHQLVDLGVGCPAGHAVRAEVVDVALHEHVGNAVMAICSAAGMPTATIFFSISQWMRSFRSDSFTLPS